MEVIARQAHQKPVLGICLGMQAIAMHFGGKLYNQTEVKHGVTTEITFNADDSIYYGITNPTTVGLYHSWAVEEQTLPQELNVTARSINGVVMSLKHKSLPVYGVQFHPESVLTPFGKKMIANWIELYQ